jgi:hypothetical protein
MRRPLPDEQVSVTLPINFGGHDVLHFRVVAVIDSVIALDLCNFEDTRLIPDRVRDCYLILDGPQLAGLRGHLYQRRRGDWRFKVDDSVPFPAENHVRLRMCAPVALEPLRAENNLFTPAPARDAPGSEPVIETETVNFGTDGVLVDVGDSSVPDRVRLTLSLPGEDDAIQARARLTARQGSLYEFRYEAMDGHTLGRLASFIIEDQRAALRRRRAKTVSVALDDDIDL